MKIKDKPAYVYDVEVFKNVFHCTILDTETERLHKFECSIRTNQMSELCDFFLTNDVYFVGYNNIHYDNPIINYCIEYFSNSSYTYDKICESIFNLSNVITSEKDNIDKWKKWKYAKNFLTLDLLTMYYSTALRVSLKEMQVTMMYKNVQEFNSDWQAPLSQFEIDEMIAYNINDVMSTYELLKRSEDMIKLRIDIEKVYRIDCLSKDNVNMGMQILAEEYMRKTGIPWSKLKDMRSPADTIILDKVILPFINFELPILKDLLSEMKSLIVSPGRKGYEKKFIIQNLTYSVGVGGIHSINTPELIIPKEDELLIDADVASLYPSMLLNFDCYPKHLGAIFKETYEDIRVRRLAAKKAKDKLTDISLKYALNGLSGNLQNEYSWCYDPYAVMKIKLGLPIFEKILKKIPLIAGTSFITIRF